jgi:hypothetical protein
MKQVSITKGKFAIVDDKYYRLLVLIGSWCLQSNNYAATRFRGKLWLMHDLIMFLEDGPLPPGKEIDHKNRNGLDNRLCNLRYASTSQNSANKLKRSDNTSGYKGVFWHKKAKKWMAQVKYEGVTHYIGLFTSKYEAAQAYNKKLYDLAGDFACLN